MNKIKFKRIIIILLFGILIVIFCLWQNNDIVITNYDYKTTKIDQSLNGYKIAQISDLHNKEFGKNQRKLLSKLENVNPDIIVITGDIIDSNHTDVDVALKFVKGAVGIAPVYYITGNHEFWVDNSEWNSLMKGMEQYGVTLLDNKSANMERESGKDFYLIGLGDNNLADNTLASITSQMDSGKLQILLAHEPQYFDNYSDADIDLVLSGHAHGGQIRLPLIGGLIAPDQGFFPKYTSGTYLIHNTTMIVSRGLGNSIIPIRIFNRPEIVIVTLEKS